MKDKREMSRLYQLAKEEPRTEEYEIRTKIFVDKREEILKQIGEQNREPIEELTNLIHDMDDELSRQAYCKGFSKAVKLLIEAI